MLTNRLFFGSRGSLVGVVCETNRDKFFAARYLSFRFTRARADPFGARRRSSGGLRITRVRLCNIVSWAHTYRRYTRKHLYRYIYSEYIPYNRAANNRACAKTETDAYAGFGEREGETERKETSRVGKSSTLSSLSSSCSRLFVEGVFFFFLSPRPRVTFA